MRRIGLMLFALCAVILATGMVFIARAQRADIAVTSSYLQAAVGDILQRPSGQTVCLAQPGSCPGHFDIRPAQAKQIRDARIVLRFDFQGGLAGRFDDTRMAAISCEGGMCEPATYISVCRQTADALCGAGLLSPARAQAARQRIGERMERLAREQSARICAAGLTGAAAVSSGHQAAFCHHLGLNVVATLGGSDAMSIRSVQQTVDRMKATHCRLVVANRPEGTQLAELLAERGGVRLVIFDNFPLMNGECDTFDQLYTANVDRLLAASALP